MCQESPHERWCYGRSMIDMLKTADCAIAHATVCNYDSHGEEDDNV
jgi:hypothetical protein